MQSQTTPAPQFEYQHTFWGELIYGTKQQIQSFGIATGAAFPGELGGPKRKLNVTDPRGFETSIERWDGVNRYCVSIRFPNRGREQEQWVDCVPGVRKCSGYHWFDEYVGTAEALAAAGLVRVDQLPGQPGMRKVTVTIFADGTLPMGPATANHKRGEEPGTKRITRATKTTYRVSVVVSEAEKQRRLQGARQAERDHVARMFALPRPAPLNAARPLATRVTKAHLSLVWSAASTTGSMKNIRGLV